MSASGGPAELRRQWCAGARQRAALRNPPKNLRASTPTPNPRPHEIDDALLPLLHLPRPVPQPNEMEDVRWFHRDWLAAADLAAAAAAAAGGNGAGSNGAGGGSGGGVARSMDDPLSPAAWGAGPGAGLDFGGFQIPGGYSLAHRLITGWLRESGSGGGGGRGESWSGDLLPQVRGRGGAQGGG
jgi:hypothetical protein